MISINLTLVLTMLNFIILVILLRIILFKPLLKFLDERSQTIAKSLKQAEDNKLKADALDVEKDSVLKEARLKAAEIADKTLAAASNEGQEVIKNARLQAHNIIEATKQELETEAVRVKQDLRKDIASMVVELSSKVLEREIAEKDHEEMIKKSFNALGV
jgi:F-type H+-transporting ATPase subunit b